MTNTKDLEKQEARDMNRDPISGEPGAHPIGTGVGATSGAFVGAVIGGVAGPIGSVLGGAIGAVAGGYAGKDLGEEINPTAADAYWLGSYRNEPYYKTIYTYDDYAPAYRAGYAHRVSNYDGFWEQAEIDLKAGWERTKDKSRLDWEDAKHAAHAAWHRVEKPGTAGKTNGVCG